MRKLRHVYCCKNLNSSSDQTQVHSNRPRLVESGHWFGLRSIRSGPNSGQSLYGLANTHLLVCPFRQDQNMGIGHTKQKENWYWADLADRKMVLARPNRPKYGYWPDRTDPNMGIGQTEQTEVWVLARPNRPKFGCWQDRTDRNMGIRQTEQTEIGVLARPNIPKHGYWPDRTDRDIGLGQTE